MQNSISSRRNPDLGLCPRSEEGVRMSRLAAFFKGADMRLGVFYPNHALIAIFPDIKRAQNARGKLGGAGFSDDEALVAPAVWTSLTWFTRNRKEVECWAA